MNMKTASFKVHATVKFVARTKGYGFIVVKNGDGTETDYFLHAKTLPQSHRIEELRPTQTLVAEVRKEMHNGQMKGVVTNVLSIGEVPAAADLEKTPRIVREPKEKLPTKYVTLRLTSTGKKFSFGEIISAEDKGARVFVSAYVIERARLSVVIEAGQEYSAVIVNNEKGFKAIALDPATAPVEIAA